MYTFHLTAFRMRHTLVLLTPVSLAHCVTDFHGNVVNLSKTIAKEAGLVDVRGLPDIPPMHVSNGTKCIKLVTKPSNCQACWTSCLKLTLPLTLNFSDIFKRYTTLKWTFVPQTSTVLRPSFTIICHMSHDLTVVRIATSVEKTLHYIL